ncbi:PatA/PatG family cyanobactin maturation protease [Enterobacter sp. Cy-643]|uniref:PatA/PatG family cyanobactin maturation protease n=1 Tax=Enterobacter sp. Cy-643 TaxID=2608346 RepID=UPI00141F53D9|nr:PatA/PatG family cyanobactin maturation protease [Enterobacter sp. Cy-643]NIF33352.1 PatA/PatG family cyanobactin maturation protease [Enterobacter sp. Cy-643]
MKLSFDNKNNRSAINHLDYLKQLGLQGEKIKVAVIDSVIDTRHELLSHLIIDSDENYKADNMGHGTAVCSIISGRGVGFAEKCHIINIPVFHEDHQGNLKGCSELTLAKAINEAKRQGCQIVNISGASLSVNGRGSDQLRQAVEACQQEGILIVAAVGNEGVEQESLPAALESVLAVGACDSNGMPSAFNNYGWLLRKKMILASGVDIPAAISNNHFSFVSGSSFAAPVITGIAALLFNALSLHGKQQAAEIIKNMLFDSATTLQPAASEKPFFKLHRLNIASLLQHLARELISPKHNRIPIMSTEENNITPAADIVSSLQTEIALPFIESAEIVSAGLADAPQNVSLSLPQITDSAAHNYVHAPVKSVVPQSSADARSVRHQEKVFLIGTLGYDFGTEARLDYFTQVMGNQKGHPFDPTQMATHLTENDNIEQSDALIWTLKVDGIPVYAIKPDSQFSVLEYARIVEFLHDQETKGVERVSVAGIVSGETRLFNGQHVPTVTPVLRGMFNWKSRDLTKLIMGDDAVGTPRADELLNFINRIYYELRNRGYSSHERAINYAATNAYQMREIFDDAFNEDLFLNQISAVVSPVSRPESDCWDVVLEFFNPKERLTKARKLYRYTIDVSDLMPVTIGTLRSWYAY